MKMLAEIPYYIFRVHIDLALENHSEFFLRDENRNYMQADDRDLMVNMLQVLEENVIHH